jgi:hypothetical protein
MSSEDYGILDDGSQGNYTIQSNKNFRGQEVKQEAKQPNRIKLMEWKDNVDSSAIQSVKFIEEKKGNPSSKSIKSIPKSDYCFDNTSIFDRLSKGYTMQCEIHRDKKSLSGMTEYHVLLQDSKQHIITVRKEGKW